MSASAPKVSPDPILEPASDGLTAYHGVLKSYFIKRLKIGADAEDCVHEVYARVLASAMQKCEVRSWRQLLLRVARSVVADKFRRDGARGADLTVPLEEGLDGMADLTALSPEAKVTARQQLDVAWKILKDLDPECREAFLMARVEGFAHKEIAKKLGIGTVMVGRHIQRALFELARQSRNS